MKVRANEDVVIGSRIRKRRQALSLTQAELAGEVGVTHQHISRVEAGDAAPSLELLVALATSLGATTDYLLTGDDSLRLDARGAIRAEPRLTAGAKRHLLGLIDELRR